MADAQEFVDEDASVAPKKRSVRMRSYVMESLQIGTFFTDLTSSENHYSNRLRFYFTQGFLVYDFEFEFWVSSEGPNKFLGAIIIPFDAIAGICCKSKEIYFVVSAPPRLIIGSNGMHAVPPPVGIDITNGQLQVEACHKITLARAQGYLVQQVLFSHYPGVFKILHDISPWTNPAYQYETTVSTDHNEPNPTEYEGEDEILYLGPGSQ